MIIPLILYRIKNYLIYYKQLAVFTEKKPPFFSAKITFFIITACG